MDDRERFQMALQRFDEENGRDPHRVEVDGVSHPRELLYSQWLTRWVLTLAPEASEALQLAARCQHLCRWVIPRQSYEMTRVGYLKWRADLKQFHAQKSGEILGALGYPSAIIERVQSLNLKKELGRDEETQTLEDALCLVTLEHQLSDLVAKTEAEKMVEIIRKTWKKMSPSAREHALKLTYTAPEQELIGRALA